MSMSDWVVRNTSLRKKPFSFDGYEFQIAIVDDFHPDLSVIKCSQVGLTEVQLRKYLGFLQRNNGTTGIFSLPDEKMYKRVSQTRVRPIIEQDKVFNLEGGSDKPIRSIPLYQIADSYAYFVGNTEGDATSIPADILFHDELDLSNMEMIGLFQSRLQNSNWKITQKFSTPTFVGFGIDASYEVSDQFEYLLRCGACRHYNIPDFDLSFLHLVDLDGNWALPDDMNDLSLIDDELAARIDYDRSFVKCEHCHRPLNLGDYSAREWVAKHPGRLGRGYRVRPFCTARLSIKYIIRQLLYQKQQDNLRRWYNTVLGRSYTDAKSRLSEQAIGACMVNPGVPEIPADAPVLVGIDMGLTCHLVLGTPLGDGRWLVFHWEAIPQELLIARVKQILDTHNVIGGAVDRHPYTPLSNEIYEISEKRIMPVEYRGQSAVRLVQNELEEITHAQGNRTEMLDKVAGMVRRAKYTFCGYGHQQRLITEHLRDMVRDDSPDPLDPQPKPAEWKKLTGQDHYFHALAFLMFSMRLVDTLLFNSDQDPREEVGLFGLNVMQQNTSKLGIHALRGERNYPERLYGRLG